MTADREPVRVDAHDVSLRTVLGEELREHLPLLGFVAVYILGCSLVRGAYGIDSGRPFAADSLVTSLKWWFSLTLAPVIGFHFLHHTALHLRRRFGRSAVEKGRSWLAEWSAYRKRHITMRRILRLALVVIAVAFLMTTFVAFKGVIPEIRPFSWDYSLMRLDRWMHGGHHPWELLQRVLGSPAVTNMMDFVYYLWFPIGLGIVIWQAWSADSRTRMQFFLTYAVSWVLLGTVGATLMSSGGPVYYGRITGLADPFAPLMTYLHAVDVGNSLAAIRVQTYLWEGYSGAADHSFEGIAAMPSLHVAMAVLFALAGFRWRRWLGVLLSGFAVLILLGSVHLGWHYAVDGYVSIIFVVVCWILMGWALDRYWAPRSAARHPI